MTLQISKQSAKISKIAWTLTINENESEKRAEQIETQMKEISSSIEENENLIRLLWGIPRLEKWWAPINAESNDLYQFRMSSVFFEKHKEKRGTYLLYYRKPKDAWWINVFGVSRALETLQNFKFDPRFLYRLFKEKKITEWLFQELIKLDKLDVNVKAVEDWEFIGPNTPLMIVEGPLWQVQLVETVLLQCLDYASWVATRVWSLVNISEKPIIDMWARRAPWEEAAVTSALASTCNWATWVANTITAEVAERYWLNDTLTIWTTAHAFTESYFTFNEKWECLENPALNEFEAYKEYADIFPVNPVVLIDTIKKEIWLSTVARLYKELNLENIWVRDDSDISWEAVVWIFDELKNLWVDNFFIVISDNLKPVTVKKIKDDIIALRWEEFYKNLDLRLWVGTYLARPEPVWMGLNLFLQC